MAYSARVLLDSVSPAGVRLTTLEVTFPRFVLAEFNTHRSFCLDGETRLYFDLPVGLERARTRRFAMTIRELFDKWHHCAAPRANRHKTRSPRSIDPNREYTAIELAAMNLRSCNENTGEIYHTHLREVTHSGQKPVFRVTLKNGHKILSSKDHRFLTNDGWRSLEDAVGLSLSPGSIAVWSRSAEFAVNGIEAYKDPHWLAGLRDAGLSAALIARYAGVTIHQVKYQFRKHRLRAANPEVVWELESHFWRGGITPERKRIGVWTKQQAFRAHRSNNFRCVLCGSERELHAHHIDPVAHNVSRAYDRTNLTTLCNECHGDLHQRNLELLLLRHVEGGKPFGSFWASLGGLRLRKPYLPKKKWAMVRHFVPVQSIEYVGVRDTYDVEVEGPYHNFVAEGFIVHNSRNSASSRAVPTSKLIERTQSDPALPLEWGRNKAGMSASDVLDGKASEEAKRVWLAARDDAVAHARRLLELNVHKQELNRILEPFLWHTVIVTATEWENFFELRCAPNAQPEIRAAALLMREAIDRSTPQAIDYGQWHTPLLQPDEAVLEVETRRRISAARCARISYLTHEGKREIEKDLELYERLKSDRHLSPFEHVATPAEDAGFHANFRGWLQMRSEIEDAE